MSQFWSRLQPSTRIPRAHSVELANDERSVRFVWEDSTSSHAFARALRLGCPCAACVDERSGQPLLDPVSVAADIRVLEIRAVGNYAVGFTFSDGHRSGIFDWARLRRLGESPA